ncbi:type II toxin-antitoxin system RelE/ParE family toxin [Leptolyngbya sp. CCNP1308]|uniref:type II toxin-antitoxin system RelE family toxin n=1 Tax=Leptolyngbya sp. CCNP1308 TaxID=3110255 RepID=UPI002B206A5B|nr:type II toxin-antitoxin system RelE/ParE family toxin [Leptolyngbya sp. CCNP1308]MEA5447947.1 type II toxin-antitoxin system RelE/ParE family toxin [Leptolyngbya sp. CCNP1308]
MAQYEIQFKSSAAKEFRKLSLEIKTRLQKAINALKAEPRPAGMKKLAGEDDLCRIRVGDYRVIYKIDDDIQLIMIMRIRHRREAYQ